MNAQSADTNGKPTVISIFSGCGGSSLGYKWAGFRELLAIDFDENSVETFKLNFPEVPIWKRDITIVTAQEILQFCKIRRGDLDVLDGSPPCQGFSISGKQKIDDPRNNLFMNFIQLINGLQPRVFLMENVPGMLRGNIRGMFNEITRSLKDTGYIVKCKLMDSVYYGVPQSRKRLIWIGVRPDLRKQPIFPEPSKKIISTHDALIRCPDGIYYIPGKDTLINSYIKKIMIGETGAKYHPRGNFFNLRRLNPLRPSYTLPKNAGRNIIHPTEDRFITDREAARLSSFPDDFILVGSAIDRISRIGNAVMPKFMEAIATSIYNNILNAA